MTSAQSTPAFWHTLALDAWRELARVRADMRDLEADRDAYRELLRRALDALADDACAL